MSRGEFGPVLVGYRLKKNGTAKEIVVLESPASKAVQESAIRVIAALRCKPSKEWIANGGLERQLKMNVLFQYRGGESVKAIDPEVEVISFVTEPLPKFIKH